MSENIEVVLRVRPPNNSEVSSGDTDIWSTMNTNTIYIHQDHYLDLIKTRKVNPGQNISFTFNQTFSKSNTNNDVYTKSVQRIALSCLQGINGTVFMYGQTGSGKTFTMMGTYHDDETPSQPQSLSTTPLKYNRNAAPICDADDHNLQGQPPLTSGRYTSMTSNPSAAVLNNMRNGFASAVPNINSGNAPELFGKRPLAKPPTRSPSMKSRSPTRFGNSQRSPGHEMKKGSTISFGYQQTTPLPERMGQSHQNTNFFSSSQHKRNGAQMTFSLANATGGAGGHSTGPSPAPHGHGHHHGHTGSSGHLGRAEVNINTVEFEQLKNRPENNDGILILAVKDIFSEIERQSDRKYFIRCSYIEIYMDQVYDLLKPQEELSEILSINEDVNKEFYVKGATEEIVSSIEEIIGKIRKGEVNRHYASTIMNHCSSRSHTIFRLFVESIPADIQVGTVTESILNFVDLAGSEKMDIHDASRAKWNSKENFGLPSANFTGAQQGPFPMGAGGKDPQQQQQQQAVKDRIKEGKNINKSLFFLNQVISLRSQGKQDIYIPYRNSPLTKILRSSLGGNSRTAIVLCINPCLSQYEQTMTTIRFGLNAKKIENKVRVNIVQDLNDELKYLMKEYEKKISDMERERDADNKKSEGLLAMIEKLQEQKKVLASRLLMAERTNDFNSKKVPQVMVMDITSKKASEDDGQMARGYVHYNNIGVVAVWSKGGDPDGARSSHSIGHPSPPICKFDSQGKFALAGLKNVKEQNRLLESKLASIGGRFEEFQKEKMELLHHLHKKERTLKKTKEAFENLRRRASGFMVEADRLRQVATLYQNKNPRGMKRLSVETLTKLENNLLELLDAVKTQKCIKLVSSHLKNNCDGKEIPADVLENLGDVLVSEDLHQTTMSKMALMTHTSGIQPADISFDELFQESRFHVGGGRNNHGESVLQEMERDGFGESINSIIQSVEIPGSGSPHKFDSLNNYYKGIARKDRKRLFEHGEVLHIDHKLSKLRSSFEKMNEKFVQGEEVNMAESLEKAPHIRTRHNSGSTGHQNVPLLNLPRESHTPNDAHTCHGVPTNIYQQPSMSSPRPQPLPSTISMPSLKGYDKCSETYSKGSYLQIASHANAHGTTPVDSEYLQDNRNTYYASSNVTSVNKKDGGDYDGFDYYMSSSRNVETLKKYDFCIGPNRDDYDHNNTLNYHENSSGLNSKSSDSQRLLSRTKVALAGI